VTESRASKCPRCGWRGWKDKKEWLHIPAAGILRGGTGHAGGDPASRPVFVEMDMTGADAAATDATPVIEEAELVPAAVEPKAPDFDAIDENLADVRTNQPTYRSRRGGRSRHHHP
jgi:hypothetical protein